MREGQIVLLAATMLAACVFLSIQGVEEILLTSLLVGFAGVVGVWLINVYSSRLSDRRVQHLSYLYLFKLVLCLLLVRYAWVPALDQNSAIYGYDPQRFYFNAQDLLAGRYSGVAVTDINLNYAGIVYWYAAQFALFGQNPYIPALTNGLLTLLAVLVMMELAYHLRRKATNYDWCLGLSLIIPEVIWYDCLTARETPVMSLITIASLGIGSSLIARKNWAFLPFVAIAGVGLMRTSMLIPIIASSGFLYLLSEKPSAKRSFATGLALASLLAIVIAAPVISGHMGSYQFDYVEMLTSVLNRNELIDALSWSQNSIGRLLIPNNPFEAVLFALPRLALYLIAPWPNIGVSWSGLVGGNWGDWQGLFAALSSPLYVLFLPNIIAATLDALSQKERRLSLSFYISYWTVLFAVVGGNQIIHERYRLASSMLFCGCIWVARDCPERWIRNIRFVWFGVLIGGALFYAAYKGSSGT